MDFCKLTGLSNAFFVIICLIRMLQCHIQVPAKLQKNLHQGLALMQIFLNLIESFSIFYVYVTFFMLRFAWRIFIPLRSGPGSRAQCFLRCNGYQTVRDQYH